MVKRIYWLDGKTKNEGTQLASVHVLVGYSQGSIDDYMSMAATLRETFPQATNDKLFCSKVIKSSSVNGFTILVWTAEIPKQEYPGWYESTGNPEYCWS